MRIGIITDIHLTPAGHPPESWHNPYAMSDALPRFQRALRQCIQAGVDAIAILGDVSHLGDEPSLIAGVAAAAAIEQPILLVPGNHDALPRHDALARAVEQVGSPHVRMARPRGERVAGAGIVVAGLALVSGDGAPGLSAQAPHTGAWADEPVLLLSHFPLLSLRQKTLAAGLKYAGDLANLADVADPLLSRAAPTVVIHGHLHLNHAEARATVLQLGCAALIEPPFAVNVLQIGREDGQVTVQLVEVPAAPVPSVRLPRLAAPDQRWRFADGVWHDEALTPAAAETGRAAPR